MPLTTIGASGEVKSPRRLQRRRGAAIGHLESHDAARRRNAVGGERRAGLRRAGNRREDPARPGLILRGGERGAGSRGGELRRHLQRRLVIAGAERRRIQQVETPVIRRHRDKVLVLVAEDDWGRVEIGVRR
jgi:hypothetical protein